MIVIWENLSIIPNQLGSSVPVLMAETTEQVAPATLAGTPKKIAPSIATMLPRRNPKSMLSWLKDFGRKKRKKTIVGIR